MKLKLIAIFSMALLAGCAYQQGVLEDKASESTSTPSAQATTIQTPSQQTSMQPQNKAGAAAAKIISPLTGG